MCGMLLPSFHKEWNKSAAVQTFDDNKRNGLRFSPLLFPISRPLFSPPLTLCFLSYCLLKNQYKMLTLNYNCSSKKEKKRRDIRKGENPL